MSSLEVTCEYCSTRFEVPYSMKGGLANCPHCEKATKVSGGAEPLFWVICIAVLLGGIMLAGLATWAAGWAVGITILVLVLVVSGFALAAS